MTRSRRAYVAVAVLATWLLPAGSQGQVAATGSVRGRVVSADGAPVIDAVIHLVGKAEPVRTRATGEFLFLRVAVGPEVIQISAIGYTRKRQDIRVSPDSGWMGTIVLDRVAQRLADVDVNAAADTKYDDFFRRRRLGSGTFRTREDFEKMGATDIVSVLQGIPGVSVAATSTPYGEREVRFRMARCPGQPPNLGIYVNGKRVALFSKKSENKGSELSGAFRKPDSDASTCEDCVRMGEILSSFALLDVMFVEFYRGPGQIPNDLDRGDSCAALVVWTR